jgi:hypothetical protein
MEEVNEKNNIYYIYNQHYIYADGLCGFAAAIYSSAKQ